MKKFIMMIALLMAVAIAQAQTANDELTKEIKRSLELSESSKMFKEALNLQLQTMVDKGILTSDKLPSIINEAEALFMPKLEKRLLEIYKENFTLDEIKQMNAYLASPVGQKALKLTPLVVNESTKISQDPDILQKFMEILMRYKQ